MNKMQTEPMARAEIAEPKGGRILAMLAQMRRLHDDAGFDDFLGEAQLTIVFDRARLHHHGARRLARP